MDSEDLDPVELQDFPLLRDCLQSVDPDVGFDIEIKYPLDLKVGGSEMSNFFERNLYIDTILREIFKYCGNRRILFSCFDPDTCAMLQAKQIRFPVFQLGVCPEYTDTRQQSFEMLCYSAKANELLGVAVNGEELLRNPHMAEFARDLGLIVLVWGTASNDSQNMKRLKELGVHGLIYDRMQEHKQAGTISMLKLNKSAKRSTSEDEPRPLISEEILESGRSTPSPPLLSEEDSEHESGASTPSHQPPASSSDPNSTSLSALSLAESLCMKLGLDASPSQDKNERRMTLTMPTN